MRREQVESVEDKTNVPLTLSFSSCLVLFQRECKPGIALLGFEKDSLWLESSIYEKTKNKPVFLFI